MNQKDQQAYYQVARILTKSNMENKYKIWYWSNYDNDDTIEMLNAKSREGWQLRSVNVCPNEDDDYFIHNPDILYEYTIRFWSHYEKEETYEFLDALWDDAWELVCVAVYYQEDDEYYFRRRAD